MRSRRTSPKAEATWEEGVSGRKEAPRPCDTGKHFPKAQPLGYDGHDARSHIPSTAQQADRPPRSPPGPGEDTGPEQPVPRRTCQRMHQQTRKKIKTGGKAGTGRDASLVQWAGRGREGRVQEDVEKRGTSSFCRRDNSTAQPVTSTFREPGRQERPFCPEDQLLGRGCTITGTHDSALCGFYRHAQPYCSKESTGGLTEAGRGRGGRGLRAKPSLQDAKSTGVR